MPIRHIQTQAAPAAAGHYSQATVHAGLIHVAGQLPYDPVTRELVPGGIEAQAERALRNVEAILAAAGSDWAHVLKVNVFVTDIALWGAVNTVYARVLGDARPARAVIPARELKPGCLLEVDCVAVVREA